MITLYSVRQDHLNLIRLIEDAEGELTPEIEQALQLNEEQFQDKAISYANIVRTFDADENVIDLEIERLEFLKGKKQQAREKFKAILSDAMLQYGVEKIETPTLKLSFRKSESVEVDDNYLTDEWKTTKVISSPSKDRIKKALKAGEQVPGATLVVKQNLQIK